MNLKATAKGMLPSKQADTLARWAPVPLRPIVGYGFAEHGFAKLARGPESFATILHAIGVPAPHIMEWSTILVELVGGVAILLGAFVMLVSIPMAAVLLVAIVTVHLPNGFSSIKLGGDCRRCAIRATGL
jgi:putative oxidoreductase